MNRVVQPPNTNRFRPDGTLRAGWWHNVGDGRIVCDLCPRTCHLKPGDRGFCFVRQNLDDELVLTTYGKSTGFCIDPIEKKPLNHFYPGTSVLSFGTAGCNLGCKFCQNHDISKARKTELLSEHAMPATIADAAVALDCHSVAFTYNDPIIWAEYAIDTAKVCRERGIQSVAVTAGYISPEARLSFFEFFDAANVDLKSFSEEFYEKITLSHLQPILDTLVWLQRETNVWFEITNLIIPEANDSDAELRQMCDWILDHLGDRVPVHFSAFHPDFRMQDRPRTPHETLLQAYEIAKSTGLRYVYVGNVHDAPHQSTYCDGCGQLVIERDWYQLGAYHLNRNRCGHCDHELAGRFREHPGNWGRKRQPVRIADYQQQRTPPRSHSLNPSPESKTPSTINGEPEDAVLMLAKTLVVAAATGHAISAEETAASLSRLSTHGVYVSLKRAGHLRGCCGFTNRQTNLVEGLRYAAERTVLEDPRFPRVSICELPYLDIEVWLLGPLEAVAEQGEARVEAIRVGRDGLMIQRGEQRGLLLPGVATDRGWDEETFLRQVCIKAQLPPSAWREPDTLLQRFEGRVVAGTVDEQLAQGYAYQPVVDSEAVATLASFCRDNVRLLAQGALPNYYLAGVDDGMVQGVILQAVWPSGQIMQIPKISIRNPVPMQSTLFELCETFVRQARQLQLDPNTATVDVALLEDPAMQGSSQAPDLRGATPERALLLLGPGQSVALLADPSTTAEEKLRSLLEASRLRNDQFGNLFSFAAQASRPIQLNQFKRPAQGPEVRQPAVAGKFYPATAGGLAAMVRKLVPQETTAKESWRAAMVPHAGLRYSGSLAAQVLSQIEIPSTVIILGPKHTRQGIDWAVAPNRRWSLPGFEVHGNQELAARLVERVAHLEFDAGAHQAEHSIEVELPFLHHFSPETSVVGVTIGTGSLDSCRDFAAGMAEVLKSWQQDVLLLISSDMNHFASDAETRRLDEIAMRALETRSTEHVFRTVRGQEISMCGLLPAVVALETLELIEPLQETHRVGYSTSADVTGDLSRAVGYAGMLFR